VSRLWNACSGESPAAEAVLSACSSPQRTPAYHPHHCCSRGCQTLSGRSRRAEGQARGTGLRFGTELTTQRVRVQRGIGWPCRAVRFGCALRTGPHLRNDVEVSSFPNLQYHGGVGGGGSMAGVYTSRLREAFRSLLKHPYPIGCAGKWCTPVKHVVMVSGAPRRCRCRCGRRRCKCARACAGAPALRCPYPSIHSLISHISR
jgi:hypothetical protein